MFEDISRSSRKPAEWQKKYIQLFAFKAYFIVTHELTDAKSGYNFLGTWQVLDLSEWNFFFSKIKNVL